MKKSRNTGGKGAGYDAFEKEGARVARAKAPAVPESPGQIEQSQLFLSRRVALELLKGELIRYGAPTSNEQVRFYDEPFDFRSMQAITKDPRQRNTVMVYAGEYFVSSEKWERRAMTTSVDMSFGEFCTKATESGLIPGGLRILSEFLHDKKAFFQKYPFSVSLPGIVWCDHAGHFSHVMLVATEKVHVMHFLPCKRNIGSQERMLFWQKV